jgi:hypothetical protein
MIIPQETKADTDVLTRKLSKVLDWNMDTTRVRVFLFGSWATEEKSFTEGDVDVFIGVEGYDYGEQPVLATRSGRYISIHTVSGDVYEDRYLELHWGDVKDFFTKTDSWEREELQI